MEAKKERVFLDYIAHLFENGGTFEAKGRAVASVKLFLESEYPVNRRGYKTFCLTNAAEMQFKPFVKPCLCAFLEWLGIGYSRTSKKKQDKVETLEKIEVVCEKNLKVINDFCNFLTIETDLSQSTIYSYVSVAKQFYSYSTEFSVENCRSYLATLEKNGNAPKTINLKINALSRLGEYLKKPVTLKRVKVPRSLHTDNIPTLEEYNRLLEYLKEKDMNKYFFIKILATTGARISEFLQMTYEDVMSGEVTLKGKGSKYRHFFFSKEVVKEVKQFVGVSKRSGPIMLNHSGVPMKQRGLDCSMKVWGAKVNIDGSKMHAHAFRHFFAKMYLKKDKDVIQLAELMGHESVDTTRLYLQKSYEEQKHDFRKNVTW